jgi:hypothetical protein
MGMLHLRWRMTGLLLLLLLLLKLLQLKLLPLQLLELLVDKLILLRHVSGMWRHHARHERHGHAKGHRHRSRHKVMVSLLELGRAVTAHSKTECWLVAQEQLMEIATHLEAMRQERTMVR